VSNLEGIITSVEVTSSYQLVTIIINIYKLPVKKILHPALKKYHFMFKGSLLGALEK